MKTMWKFNKAFFGISLLICGVVSPFAAAFSSGPAFPAGLTNVVLPVGVAMPHSINIHFGGGPATGCSFSPTLPAGLSVVLQANACKIAGTPTASAPQAIYTLTATNSAGSGTAAETLEVSGVSSLSYTQNVAKYTMGAAIDANNPTVVGSATGYAVTSGSLPAGLSLSPSTGVISGTPTAVNAASPVTITASNGSDTAMTVLNLGVVAAANYSSWTYYKTITYTPTGLANNVGNYPLLVKLTSSNFTFAQSTATIATVPSGTYYAAPGGGDIRFTKSDGITDLPYQIERWDGTNQVAEIWVSVPVISSGSPTTIRMYFGNAAATTTNNPTAVFDTAKKFQAVWHMNNGGTGSEMDATQNGYTATDSSVTSFDPGSTTGAIGLGRSFAGAPNQYLGTTASSVNGFVNNGHYTLSAWENLAVTPTTVYYTIIQKNDKQFALQLNNGNPNQWESAEYNQDSSGTGGTSLGGWQGVYSPTYTAPYVAGLHYIVGQHDGFTQRLYVDGVLEYANTNIFNAPQTTAPILTSNVTIGKQSETVAATTGTGCRPWNGLLDEVRMHNTVRDSNWIKADYQTQVPTGTAVTYGSTVSATPAPSNLTYSSNPAVYTVGIAIPNNNPTVTGTVTGYAVAPALPTGLSINVTTGVISGTPTVATALANYVVTASNGTGSTIDTVKITVTAALVAPTNLTYSANPAVFTVNTAIPTDSPKVTGTVTSYSVSPALPAGLNFNTTTGYITGTPTAVTAAANYLVTASNSAGGTTAFVNITVNAALAPPTNLTYSTSPATYTVGVGITNNVPTVTGTVTGYTVSPSLPGGLLLNPSTGVISGTPTTMTAAAKYAISASNGAGSTVDSLTITVNNPAGILSASQSSFAIRVSGSSSVSFRLPGGGAGVELSIVDIWGRSVWSKSVSAGEMNGVQELSWDGTAMDGHRASAGIYVVRMKVLGANAGTSVQEKKITLSP